MLEGLEISAVTLHDVLASAETHRFDPEYFQKAHLADAAHAKANPSQFVSFDQLGLRVDGSAFYPGIEEFYGQGDLPFLRVADVDSIIDFEGCTRIPSELCERFNTLSRVHPGDIVFTKGGSIARIGLVTEDAAASRDLIFLDTSKLAEADRIFVYLYFQTGFFNRMLLRSSSQTAQPHLTITLVRNLPVFLGSDQFKTKCLRLVQESYAKRKQSLELLAQAEQTLLRALGLEGWEPPEPLTYTRRASQALAAARFDAEHFRPKFAALLAKMKEHGQVVRLGDCVRFCERGRQPQYAEEGLPVINSRHVRANNVVLDEDNRFATEDPAQLKLDEEDRFTIKQGDLLINGTGVGTMGRCAPYLREDKALPDNHVTILRMKPEAGLEPVFLSVQLNSLIGQMQVEQYFKGSSGQIELYPTEIKEFRIWLAPPKIQQQIKSQLEQAHQSRQEAQALLTKAKRAVEVAIEEGEDKALNYLKP